MKYMIETGEELLEALTAESEDGKIRKIPYMGDNITLNVEFKDDLFRITINRDCPTSIQKDLEFVLSDSFRFMDLLKILATHAGFKKAYFSHSTKRDGK